MSTGKIKGITVEIGGDTRPLNDALKNQKSRSKPRKANCEK